MTVRVQPGATRRSVGGRYGDATPPVLMVKVQERAVDGRANEAALRAVAAALGVRRRQVHLVSGATSRTKVFEVDPEATTAVVAQRLIDLLGS